MQALVALEADSVVPLAHTAKPPSGATLPRSYRAGGASATHEFY